MHLSIAIGPICIASHEVYAKEVDQKVATKGQTTIAKTLWSPPKVISGHKNGHL